MIPGENPALWCARLGVVPYPEAHAWQKRLEAERQTERIPDVLLLLEHPPTYTRGRRSTPDRRKIASIGVHVSRGVTTHGFAINVNNDLQPFEWIVPCGIDDCRMSSVARETGRECDMDGLIDAVVGEFARVYERAPIERALAD